MSAKSNQRCAEDWKTRYGRMFISATFLAVGCHLPAANESPVHRLEFGSPVEVAAAPLRDVAVLHCVAGTENGDPVLYYTAAGSPALFHKVDLQNNRLLATHPLPNAGRAWTHAMAPDGTVYIGGVGKGRSAHLYRYRPGTGVVEDLGAPVRNHKFIWDIVSDDRGVIYGGTWEGGHVFHYNPVKNKFHDYGRIHADEDYVRSIAWHGGQVYAGTGVKNGRVWRLNPEDGDLRKLVLPSRPEYDDRIEEMGTVYSLRVAGDNLFIYYSRGNLTLVYDLAKNEWWEEMFPQTRPGIGFPSPDEKLFYLQTDEGLLRIDLETRSSIRITRSGGNYRGGGWVGLPDLHPNPVHATVTYGGSVLLLNPESGFSRSRPSVAIGQPTPVQSFRAGPDGGLYLSGYMGTTAARIDPKSGETIRFNLGQAEGIGFLGNRVYWGEYPGARIRSAPMDNPVELRLDFQIGDHQDRPFAIAAGEGKIFFGTIPGYGRLGGALTVHDPNAEGEQRVRTLANLIPNQSIVGLAWRKGYVYGSTSIHGGLGIEPTESRPRVFKWNPDTEELVLARHLDLEGIGRQTMIGGLATGLDELIYGAVNGTVFALDPETLEVVRHRTLYPEVNQYGRWRPVYLYFDTGGILFSNVAGRVTVVDPLSLLHRPAGVNAELMTLGRDGHLYFIRSKNVMRLPVKRP